MDLFGNIAPVPAPKTKVIRKVTPPQEELTAKATKTKVVKEKKKAEPKPKVVKEPEVKQHRTRISAEIDRIKNRMYQTGVYYHLTWGSFLDGCFEAFYSQEDKAIEAVDSLRKLGWKNVTKEYIPEEVERLEKLEQETFDMFYGNVKKLREKQIISAKSLVV